MLSLYEAVNSEDRETHFLAFPIVSTRKREGQGEGHLTLVPGITRVDCHTA